MQIVFPYGQKEGKWYPLIDITLFVQQKTITIKALVDSGASFSVFRPEIAEFLKIPIEQGRAMYLEGIGGRILGYLHQVPAVVGAHHFQSRIVFSREFTVSWNLLGRDNFFNQFLVTFDERQRRTILQKSLGKDSP